MIKISFINNDFMLENEIARHLYHTYAKSLPIFDYHCHLNTQHIAEDHEFADITELWLAGDHYKWRAMRGNGVSEEKITGKASSEEKFQAWAETVESCVGNPLYHWTHLELKAYFGIDELLKRSNWKSIYDRANKIIKEEGLTVRKLIKQSNVDFICTTDDPIDSLEFHDEIAKDEDFKVKVVPTFRPDGAFGIGEETFIDFIDKLGDLTSLPISSYQEMLVGIEARIDYFDKKGALISDHGLEKLVYIESTDEEIENIFQKALGKKEMTEEDYGKFITRLLIDLGKIYYHKDWIMQIHFGAIRNNNSKMYELVGENTGFDSIVDQSNVAYALNRLLDAMSRKNCLPKTVVYNLNPDYNHIVASAVSNFQDNEEGIRGKVQFGAGWWFNDTEQGMLRQMSTLADHGLLMNFVGMLTDSRSFISYPRHEYFRRILCNYVGVQVENGKFPNDEELLKRLIENICYYNAVNYFTKK
ncbi:glucuronate isomerase [Alkaliphilus metalliredigens]|nr:glucuronate isomerase [Alkaliphilus metalliredigens]